MENNIPPSFIFPSIILYSGRRSLFGERKGHLLSNCYLIWLAWIKLKINIPWVNIPFHGGTDVQVLASCWGQGIEAPSGELGVSLGMGWDGMGWDRVGWEGGWRRSAGMHSGRNPWPHHKQEPKVPVASVLLMRNLWIVPFKHQHFLWLYYYFFPLCLYSPILT